MNDSIILKNSHIEAEILLPGKAYTEKRFDWGGIIKQVTLDGKHTFLSEESAELTENKKGGIGIIGSFEPAPDRSLYKALYNVSLGEDKIVFYFENANVKCCKSIILDQNSLYVECNLENMKNSEAYFCEYNHNFMLIDSVKTGPEYEIRLPYTPELGKRREGHFDIAEMKEKGFTFFNDFSIYPGFDKNAKNPETDALFEVSGFENMTDVHYWELYCKSAGAGVRETDSFKPCKYQFWCRSYTICSEIFVDGILNPAGEEGSSKGWTRKYTFFER